MYVFLCLNNIYPKEILSETNAYESYWYYLIGKYIVYAQLYTHVWKTIWEGERERINREREREFGYLNFMDYELLDISQVGINR